MSKKVLILDDSAVVLDVARRYLQEAGYAVYTALSMAELERHLTIGPDIILLDVQMPEIAGDDLALLLKNSRGVKVPIVLFSTLEQDELEKRATDAGLDGFVSKNDGLGALIDRVRELIG